MNYIPLNISKKFALLSGDHNKIHINKDFVRNTFLRKTVVHGINLTLYALIKFLKNKKKIKINHIKIIFKNYCLNDEYFNIIIKKNNILVKSQLNNKLLIQLKYSFFNGKNNYNSKEILTKKITKFYKIKNIKTFLNINLFSHLLYISYIIGVIKPGHGALIHSLELNKINKLAKLKKSLKIRKIINNFYKISLISNNFISETISSKILKFSLNKKNFYLPKDIINKIKYKKILFFGINGDISKSIILSTNKAKPKILSYSLKDKSKFKSSDFKKLENFLIKKRPDYIFYLSSPVIMNDINNKRLYKVYEEIYCKKFQIILNLLNKNQIKTKIFYPSTIYLNSKKKYFRFKSYLRAKEKAEKICKNHPYSKFIKYFRLPQFKTRSNYNILGFYEGRSLHQIRKYLIKFF